VYSELGEAPKYKRVKTDNLQKLLTDEYGLTAWFVFKGWPETQLDLIKEGP
jgi:hypothetical protein